MRLTVKLVLWFFVCVVVAVGVSGFHTVTGELERYEDELVAKHVVMGRVLRAAFSEVMDTDGEARAVSVLDYTDKRMFVDIRWVHLDDAAPPERRPHTPIANLTPLLADREVHDKSDGKLRSYIPVHIEGRPIFSALEFSEQLDGEREVVARALVRELRVVVAVAFATGIASGILGLLFVARPMRLLIEHARRVGRGDLSPMATSRRNDEIAELGREMNAMCIQLSEAQSAQKKALEQLRHAERLSTVGKLASGLAHELGTPLNVITLRAKAIAQGRAAGERARDAASSIAEQAMRMTNLVRHLLDFARRRAPQRDIVDVTAVVRRTADLIGTVAAKAKIRIAVRIDPQTREVRGDGGQLEQVLMNLLMNGIQAISGGGTIEVATANVTAQPPADHGGSEEQYVRISVRDTGSGIPDEALPHIFEPFFTTKVVGEGTGLGLAVCYGIVRDHGGWIDVKTGGDGSEFLVYLPLASSPPAEQE